MRVTLTLTLTLGLLTLTTVGAPLPAMQTEVTTTTTSPFSTVVTRTSANPVPQPLPHVLKGFEMREEQVARWHADKGRAFVAREERNKVYPNDFFEFIPTYVASLPLDGKTVAWTSSSANFTRSCFASASASLSSCGSDCVELVMDVSGRESTLCEDLYLFGSVKTFHVHEFVVGGKHSIKFDKLDADEMADLKDNGMRVFHFISEVLQDVYDFGETLEMFLQGQLPIGPPSVDANTAAINLQFLKDKMDIDMPPRPINLVNMTQIEQTVHTGDFMGIIRLDGLDPMIAWGMGSNITGHTVFFIRFPTDEVINGVTYTANTLYVSESQTKSHYWPVNLIQINPFDKWVEMAHAASYNVVHLPLRESARAKLNVTGVIEYLKQVTGTPYGYANFLAGWQDSPNGNNPKPLSVDLIGIIFALLQKISPDTANLMWNQGLNHRLNTTGLDCYQIYQEISARGLSLGQVLAIPEQDDWLYLMPGWAHPEKPIPSSVCDVHVCRAAKAGGLFGDIAHQINCAEFTNWDMYSLDIYDPNPTRPPTCIQADPHNPLCQLMGTNTVHLHLAGTVKPYPHMREHCAGVAPHYYWGNNTC